MINYSSFVLKDIFRNCTSAFSCLKFLMSPKYSVGSSREIRGRHWATHGWTWKRIFRKELQNRLQNLFCCSVSWHIKTGCMSQIMKNLFHSCSKYCCLFNLDCVVPKCACTRTLWREGCCAFVIAAEQPAFVSVGNFSAWNYNHIPALHWHQQKPLTVIAGLILLLLGIY